MQQMKSTRCIQPELLISSQNIPSASTTRSTGFLFCPPVAAGWVQENGQWRREAAYISGDRPLLVEEQLSSSGLGPTAATITPAPTDLDLDVQARQSAAYKGLHRRIIDAGLYKCPILTGYGPEFIRYNTLFGVISAYAYYHSWFITSRSSLVLCGINLCFSPMISDIWF